MAAALRLRPNASLRSWPLVDAPTDALRALDPAAAWSSSTPWRLVDAWLTAWPDDWVSRARLADALPAWWAASGLDELRWAPDAPVDAVLTSGLPLPGAMMARAGDRWWVWAGELFD